MTIIETIRAEIERLKGQLIRGACASQVQLETTCKEEAYNEVLAILDTLKEKSEIPTNLEEAAENISMTREQFDAANKHWYNEGKKDGAMWQREQFICIGSHAVDELTEPDEIYIRKKDE